MGKYKKQVSFLYCSDVLFLQDTDIEKLSQLIISF